MKLLSLLASLTACGRLGFDAVGTELGSVQRGTALLDAPMISVAIEPIDPATAFVICDFRVQSGSSMQKQPTCELADATTLVVRTELADGTATVGYQVVAFESGARVQRGSELLGDQDLVRAVTLDPIRVERAWTIVTWRTASTAPHLGRFQTTARLASATELVLQRALTGTTMVVAWQVIELSDAHVRHGIATLVDGADRLDVGIGPVDPAASFLVMTANGGSQVEADSMARGWIDGASSLAFARNGTAGVLDISWSVASLAETHVQHGEVAMAAKQSVPVPFAAVDPDRAFIATSVSGGLPASTSDRSSILCTASIETSDTLVLMRGAAQDVASAVRWSVVAWPP